MSEQKVHIEKGSVQETLMIPLYGRKLCADVFSTYYQDKYAEEVCNSIDYDFSHLESMKGNTMYQFASLEAAARELDMIWEIKDYLKTHPNAAVVNLGCGLNMTGRSADNGTCKIINIDLPDVIESRNEIIPAGEREENIAADLNDFSWMDKIDASEGAVLYAAGVFCYFTQEQIRSMVLAMVDKFPGGRLVFDSVGKFGRDKLMKKTIEAAGMTDVGGLFCVKDDSDLEGWSDKITVSRKSYMKGYYPLEDPNIKGIHKFLAMLCDKMAKMMINRMDFAE